MKDSKIAVSGAMAAGRRALRASLVGVSVMAVAPMLAIPAAAQNLGLVDNTGFAPQDVLRLLKGWGYPGDLKSDPSYPRIAGKIEGLNYEIYFYGCKNAQTNCRDYQFFTTFTFKQPVPLEKINEWNDKKRWAFASTDGKGEVRLKMDVDPDGSDLAQGFESNFNIWKSVLISFKNHIGG